MNGIIYFRVEANQEIGLGHITRCFALAQMLSYAFDINFVVKEMPLSIIDKCIELNFTVKQIDQEEDLLAILKPDDFVVIDHYGLDINYHNLIRTKGSTIVCIDDLHEQEFAADLIINHGPQVVPTSYRVHNITQFAVGLEYALLRPIFLAQAKIISTPKNNLDSLLICFGGADPKNLTLQVLKASLAYAHFKTITIITGAMYAFGDKLNEVVSTNCGVNHLKELNESEMVTELMKADVAIVPASGILLEALSVGNQIISGMYVANQKIFFENYKMIGAFVSAEDFISENITHALKQLPKYEMPSKRLIDGNSDQRIIKLFNQLNIERQITLRTVSLADLNETYTWATDPLIRAYSFNKDEITPEGHKKWFNTRLQDKNCIYYIAELNEDSIGSIRFDIADEVATISYLISPKQHSKGLGIMVLKLGIKQLIEKKGNQVKQIKGYVFPENVASVKAFERLGFTREKEKSHLKFTFNNN